MNKYTLQSILRRSLLLLILTGVPLAAHAALTANFSDGVGTTSPSTQFVGAAGNGWATAWSTQTVSSELEVVVSDANPFAGAFKRFDTDRYLSVKPSADPSHPHPRRTSVSRGYGFSSGLNPGAKYTVAFNLRFDSLSGMTSSNDYFTIFDAPLSGLASTSNGSQSWNILIRGGTGTNDEGTISLHDGDRSGNLNRSIDTGVVVSEGQTYSFVVDIDPVAGSWYVTITDGTVSFSSAELGFRSMPTSLEANRYLYFNTLFNSTGTRDWEYSLDGLTIIPEPGTIAGVMGVLIVGLLFLRRRR